VKNGALPAARKAARRVRFTRQPKPSRGLRAQKQGELSWLVQTELSVKQLEQEDSTLNTGCIRGKRDEEENGIH